jgi:hypothetical protein
VVSTPITIGMRRRTWHRTRRGRPPCREPGPHDISTSIRKRPQHVSMVADSPTGSAVTAISVCRVDSRRFRWNYCLCKHLAR